MQIHKKTNRKIIIITLLLLVLIAGGITYAAINHNQLNNKKIVSSTSRNKNEKKPKTVTTKDNDSPTATDTNNQNQAKTTDQDTNKAPARYEGGSVQNQPQLTGSVSIVAPNNQTVTIRTTINQWIDDPNGRCSLTMTGPAGQTYTDQAKLITNPQTSSCYGWDIPANKLGQINGHWNVKIVVNGGDKTGTITSEVDL